MVVLSVAEGYDVLLPLGLFVIGMVIYSLFVFHFYRFLGSKDFFSLHLADYNTSRNPGIRKFFGVIFFFIEYLMFFPLFTFFWFAFLAVLFSFLMETPTVQHVLLVSIALVSTVRVTSYYDEELSKDLAKLLPFALLAVFLVDMESFSISTSLSVISQFPSMLNVLIYYFIFSFGIELIMRIIDMFVRKKDYE